MTRSTTVSALTLLLVAAVGGSVAGCASASSESATTEDLGTTESSLVEDDAEAEEEEENTESGLEQSISGGDLSTAGGASDPSSTSEELQARVKKNPGLFFQPAGCISTTVTIADGVVKATHVFAGCTGPFGLRTFDGTVESTWKKEGNKLVVTHSTTGFKINDSIRNHQATIEYSKAGDVWTRTRTSTSSGTTGKGKAYARTAQFVVTWDQSSKCLTRNGSASGTVGNRSIERTVTGFEVCGDGVRICPKKGVITLKRAKSDTNAEVTLTLDFEGGESTKVKLGSGKIVKRALACLVR